MKKFKILLCDYYNDNHKKAINKLFNNLNGVTVLDTKFDEIIIEVEDNMIDIIQDINDCDYVMIQNL